MLQVSQIRVEFGKGMIYFDTLPCLKHSKFRNIVHVFFLLLFYIQKLFSSLQKRLEKIFFQIPKPSCVKSGPCVSLFIVVQSVFGPPKGASIRGESDSTVSDFLPCLKRSKFRNIAHVFFLLVFQLQKSFSSLQIRLEKRIFQIPKLSCVKSCPSASLFIIGHGGIWPPQEAMVFEEKAILSYFQDFCTFLEVKRRPYFLSMNAVIIPKFLEGVQVIKYHYFVYSKCLKHNQGIGEAISITVSTKIMEIQW